MLLIINFKNGKSTKVEVSEKDLSLIGEVKRGLQKAVEVGGKNLYSLRFADKYITIKVDEVVSYFMLFDQEIDYQKIG